jgi:hypothetical protein
MNGRSILRQGRGNARASTLARSIGLGAGAALVAFGLGGCLQRTIKVTSEPAGAIVWINDIEVGRTPVESDFTYFGDFSVRVRKEGYEPVVDVRKVKPPIQEQPVLDLVGEALPVNFHHQVAWHYVLEPVVEARLSPMEAEAAVVHQAKQLRTQLRGADEAAAPKGMVETPAESK